MPWTYPRTLTSSHLKAGDAYFLATHLLKRNSNSMTLTPIKSLLVRMSILKKIFFPSIKNLLGCYNTTLLLPTFPLQRLIHHPLLSTPISQIILYPYPYLHLRHKLCTRFPWGPLEFINPLPGCRTMHIPSTLILCILYFKPETFKITNQNISPPYTMSFPSRNPTLMPKPLKTLDGLKPWIMK